MGTVALLGAGRGRSSRSDVLYSFRPIAGDTWAIQTSGIAETPTRTFRPFLPWNHNGTAESFNPINNSPHVYVFPQLQGLDGQPIGVNPFSTAPDGALRISMSTAAPAVQSNIRWPGSANASTGYRTSGSLSLMGLFQAQYGRIRMRLRFDPTKGLWGEAWVVPASGESAAWELDVETSSDRPNHVSLNHFTTDFDTGVTQGLSLQTESEIWLPIPDGLTIGDLVSYEFHWTREFLRYYVNGHLLREITGHTFHTPGTLLFSHAAGNGTGPGWMPFPEVGVTKDPAFYDIAEIEWTQSADDIAHMPVQVSRPGIAGGSGGTVSPGDVITVTPAVVTGGTLSERVLILGRRKIPGTGGAGLAKTLPADLDDYHSGSSGGWMPLVAMETYTNPQGGITVAFSPDNILYRVKGAPTPPGSSWVIDEERIIGQDIGGSEWYKFGVTFSGNTVTENTSNGEHGVGMNGMPRTAGAIRTQCEAVVSGVTGHTQLQFQVASGSWSHGASAVYPLAGGSGPEFGSGWTIVSTANEDLGGGQRRFRLVVDVDSSSTDFVWLLRGFVSGSASYAGSTSRGFTLVSSSVKRIAEAAVAPTITTNGGDPIVHNMLTTDALSLPLAATGTAPLTWTQSGGAALTLSTTTGSPVNVVPASPPLAAGSYVKTFTVTNDEGSDGIQVTVNVAEPGPEPDNMLPSSGIVGWSAEAGAIAGSTFTENSGAGPHGLLQTGIDRVAGTRTYELEVIATIGASSGDLILMQVFDGALGNNTAFMGNFANLGYIPSSWGAWAPDVVSFGPAPDGPAGAGRFVVRFTTDAVSEDLVVAIRLWPDGQPDPGYTGNGARNFTLHSARLYDLNPGPAGDEVEITSVTFQAPGNTFVPAGYSGPWGYNRNVFAPGGLSDNGVANGGFTLRQWRDTSKAWPNGTRMQWEFPASNPGGWVFCWGYPGLTWGRGPWGPIWGTSGHPEPVKAGEVGTWKLDVDLEFTGQNANDLLIDVYTLPDLDFDGDVVNEISILLSHNGVGPVSWLSSEATAQITLPAPLGTCAVYKQPTSPQVMVMPHTSGARRECLVGEIDIAAVITALIGIGQVDPDAYVAGLEIGVETQRPWEHNTGPYSGTLKYNAISVEWAPAAPSGFVMVDATLYQAATKGAMHADAGMVQHPVVYEQTFFGVGKPGGRQYRVQNDPTEPAAAWFSDVAASAASQPDTMGVVGIDIEIWSMYPQTEVNENTDPAYHPAGVYYASLPKWDPANPSVVSNRVHPDGGWHRSNIKRITQAAYRTKEATGKNVSVYGYPPAPDFWGYTPGHPNAANMQAANDAFLEEHTIQDLAGNPLQRSILDVVSDMCPTLYVRVVDNAQWVNDGIIDISMWKTSVTNLVTEAIRIREAYRVAKGLSVSPHRIIPYVQPRYGYQIDTGRPATTPSSQLLGWKYMSGAIWREVLDTLYAAGVDGFTLWTGEGPPDYVYTGSPEAPTGRAHPTFAPQVWDPNAPWWIETLDFLHDNGLR